MPTEHKLPSLKEFRSNSIERYTMNRFVLKLVVIYVLSITATFLLYKGLWSQNAGFVHTVFEAFCVFTALSAFITTWSIYDSNALADKIIGMGLMVVAVFDMFHAMYYPILKLYPGTYYDLSTRFWIFGRMSEAIIFYLSSTKLINKVMDRRKALVCTLSIALGASFLLIFFPSIMPVLMIKPFTITTPKIVLEYVIIIIFVITLLNLRKSRDGRNLITNSYLSMVLLLAIPSEFFFTVFNSYNSFAAVMGHVLKMSYYFCIFRGIFVSAVIYPNEQLREHNSHVRHISDFTYSLMNRLPVAFIYFNKDDRLVFMNKRSSEIIGYSMDEAYGYGMYELLELLCGTEKECVSEYINKVQQAENEKASSTTARINTKNNGSIMITIETYRLANGDIISFFAEAKEEQSLKNLKLQTQTILNSMKKLVIVLDTGNNIIMCNKWFMDICEFEEQVTGRSIFDIAAMFEVEVQETASCKEMEVHFTTVSGHKREMLLNISEIHDMEGLNMGKIIVGTDVTDAKKEETRIRQQEKLAMIGQMAAGIVHEIKNPLAAIKGFSQLISVKAHEEKIREYAAAIDMAINDLNKVVTDFLKFAKPTSPVKKTLSINELVSSLELLISTHAYNKSVSCQYAYAETERPVTADEGQMKQVILNIVENAIDAMSKSSEPQLKLSTAYNGDRNEMVISIADNGKGMTQDEVLSVGTPFYTTKDKGTGLGMSICYQIVSEHGGIIEIKSEKEKGTVFTITIPCSE